MTIRIKKLRLRTIIGIFEWERKQKQDVMINARIEFAGAKAADTDNIADTFDYKAMTKQIIHTVENTEFFLIEKLAHTLLAQIMDHPLVQAAEVEVDKPGALRYVDSVSVSCKADRG